MSPLLSSPLSSSLLSSPLLCTLFSSFGCMWLGLYVRSASVLSAAQCKGLAKLYTTCVFPTTLFLGVYEISNAREMETSLLLTMAAAKAALALLVTLCIAALLKPTHGKAALAHAVSNRHETTTKALLSLLPLPPSPYRQATLAMAASHSFDVTLGVPLAKVGNSVGGVKPPHLIS